MDYLQVVIHKPTAPLTVEFADVVLTSAIFARTSPARPVVFSLGSNIEPRFDHLQFAVSALASTPGLSQVQVSSVFDTAAWGELAQADFLNAVLIAQTDLPAPALLARALEIEALAGRRRLVEHGPRTLDIDLISLGAEVWDSPALTVPHPRAAQRAFVLVPWRELDPQACLDKTSIAELIAALGPQSLRQHPARLWLP